MKQKRKIKYGMTMEW